MSLNPRTEEGFNAIAEDHGRAVAWELKIAAHRKDAAESIRWHGLRHERMALKAEMQRDREQ